MTPKYLGISAFAKHVGLTDSTIQSYFYKGMLPAPRDLLPHRLEHRHCRTLDRTYASMKRHPSNNSTKENN